MNKAIVALFLTLAVASAQDMCQLSLFSIIPQIQPLYTNFKNRDWVGLEKNVESLVPAAQTILQQCADISILQTDSSQRCLKSVYTIARMFAPLANQMNNSEALVNLVNNFRGASKEFYTACFFNTFSGASEEEIALFESFDEAALEDFAVTDIFGCIGSVTKMVPLFKTFIDDVKGKKGYDTVSADLKQILAGISPLCDQCGIPKPQGKAGPVDISACLTAADKLADDAYLIVKSGLDFSKIISGFTNFVSDLPAALNKCGLTA